MEIAPFSITLQLAVATTLILIVAAAPAAYLLAFGRFPGKALIETLVYLPMALPPTVMGFYLVMLMGPKGALGRLWQALTGGALLFSFQGIVVASIIYSIPFAVQPMKAAFQKIDRRMIENAYVLGLSARQTFFRVVIPNSKSGIVAAAVLVFLHSIGAFGILMMVGGSIPGETRVASIAIYEAVEMMDYRGAALMSMSFIPISYAFLLLVSRLNKDG